MNVGRRRSAAAALAALCTLAACTTTAPTSEVAPTPTRSDNRAARSQQSLEGVVRGTVNIDPGPGCSAAVAQHGEVVWQGVHGMAVLDPPTPITTDTVFHLASVSKQFTAQAVTLLAQQGKLSLDDTVADHLHGYPAWARKVTLSQLIHHTSGLPDVLDITIEQGVAFDTPVTREQLLRTAAEITKLETEPGEHYNYSNTNYLLLAAVVEEVTGHAFDEHLRTTFFEPLDLAMTIDPRPPGPEQATGYEQTGTGFEVAVSNWEVGGPGGLHATPADLARWGDVYRTGVGSVITDPTLDAVSPPSEEESYGTGIMVDDDGLLSHGGQWVDGRAMFAVSADREVTVAVACNTSIDTWPIADSLLRTWAPT